MNNMFCIIGRLVEEPRTIIGEYDEKYTEIHLAVNRNFKDENGVYETDFIRVKLFDYIATSTTEYCRKGDLIGVKGRIESNDNRLELIAEKVTFLSARNNN